MDKNDFIVKWDRPTWCPGCWNYVLQNAIQTELAELNLAPEKVFIASGIGCSSKMPHWINTYGFHSIHGRALAIATGAKLANHELKVIATIGDGDCYSIGGNHFLHTARRNLNILTIVQNNQIYGLTKGQYSPTSPKGFISVSSPHGAIEEPFNGVAVALSAGATFVARVYAGDVPHLKEVMKKAMQHKGFALVEVLLTCITYNKENTPEFWKKMLYKIDEKKHDVKDIKKAYELALQWGKNNVPIGIFYSVQKPTYEEQIKAIKKKPLCQQDIGDIDIENILKTMR